MCGMSVHVHAGVFRGQKMASDALSWSYRMLWAAWRECWELNPVHFQSRAHFPPCSHLCNPNVACLDHCHIPTPTSVLGTWASCKYSLSSWRNEFWIPGNFLALEKVFHDPSSTKQGSLLTRLHAKPVQSCSKVTSKVTSSSLAHSLDFLGLHSEPSLCHHTNLSFQMPHRLEAGAFLKSIGIWNTRAATEPAEAERVDCISPELRKWCQLVWLVLSTCLVKN